MKDRKTEDLEKRLLADSAKKCAKCNVTYDFRMKKCPICGSTKIKKDIAEIIGYIFTFGFIGLIIFIFVILCDSSSDYDEEDATKWRLCSERSGTYYKCSWSNLEDRCICKER